MIKINGINIYNLFKRYMNLNIILMSYIRMEPTYE